MFGCNHDHLFPKKYTVKDHISNAKLEKGDHYYIQTGHIPNNIHETIRIQETL